MEVWDRSSIIDVSIAHLLHEIKERKAWTQKTSTTHKHKLYSINNCGNKKASYAITHPT